jgi:glycosyltransferase involved in cell wall biosynthesis
MSELKEANVRIAGATMIKNECDIIELFVRINSRHLDHIFIVDHCSTDHTREILVRLIAEGFPLTAYAYDASDFQQSQVITWLVRQIASSGTYDYIVTLDADEFINPKLGTFAESLIASIPQGKCGHIKWESFAPIRDEYYFAEAPLFELFRQRLTENPQFYKVIISSSVGVNCTVTEGNHFATVNGQMVECLPVEATLQHVPVRSADQLYGKALIGNHRLSIKVGRGKSETTHWDDIAQLIRKNGYKLPYEDLLKIALEYASDGGNFVDGQPMLNDGSRIGSPNDKIIYKDFSKINIVQTFDMLAESLCREILQMRAST